ncbi:hypothetical protein GQ55_7G035900 [Panicum hallii var. hallii]|uniref:Uncharacterized protein n=1 Tax=Panicum hallii var. hallii TaxID=1504633 RepID=A0A2T7CSB0_9POAL|nr:hypothetical protein GQ55_7G035900 [Panicum hallii var. hallii]
MHHKHSMMLGCVSSVQPHYNQFCGDLVHPCRVCFVYLVERQDHPQECLPCYLFLVEVLEDQAKPFQFVDSC